MRRVRWFEKRSRRRGAALFRQVWFIRVLGVLLVGFALGAALAPPFSGLDTLPALGAVVVALAILLEYIYIFVLGIGVLIGTGGIVLIIPIGAPSHGWSAA